MKVKNESEVAQSCLTLINPKDCSLPASFIHGFSRQEYWSGVPLPSPIKLTSLNQLSLFYLDAKSPEWNNLKEKKIVFLANLKLLYCKNPTVKRLCVLNVRQHGSQFAQDNIINRTEDITT